jgi:o-succinylbenzoate synthase
MSFIASITKHTLKFKIPAKTSRNTLDDKILWLLKLAEANSPTIYGIGEISPLKGLSIDDTEDFEQKLNRVVSQINVGNHPFSLDTEKLPSIKFGLETAMLDLGNGGKRKVFDTPFYKGRQKIPINGLVWMADSGNMLQQAESKINSGFNCIKFKIGALDFDEECRMLEKLRKKYNAFKVEIRLDANGAFAVDEALEKLRELHRFEVHSIEQPIEQKQWDAMQAICAKSAINIALDEELIGVNPSFEGHKLLTTINPQYIILKPGLLGGFITSEEWIKLAAKYNIGWWATSALESNIGLNAIAQFTSKYPVKIHQGLGTGQLFENNFDSPLFMENGFISYAANKSWSIF